MQNIIIYSWNSGKIEISINLTPQFIALWVTHENLLKTIKKKFKVCENQIKSKCQRESMYK